MRITIGGVLIIAGAGAFVALGPLHLMTTAPNLNIMDATEKGMDWAMSLFKPEPVKVAPVQAAPVAPPPASVVVPVVQAPAAPPPAPEPVVETKAVPVVEEAPAPAPAPVKKQRRYRRAARRKGNVLSNEPMAAAASVKPAKGKAINDPLVGTYVSLKLKTGREVRGVLQEKTATQYTLELPGMGPFQYPVDNVVSVTKVE